MYPTERKRYIILGAAIGAVFLFFVVVMMLTQLRDGAQQLRDGIQEFADEGVQKISELVNGDVETLIDRINAMLKGQQFGPRGGRLSLHVDFHPIDRQFKSSLGRIMSKLDDWTRNARSNPMETRKAFAGCETFIGRLQAELGQIRDTNGIKEYGARNLDPRVRSSFYAIVHHNDLPDERISSTGGKSGGALQELTSFVYGAALIYLLGGDLTGKPTYTTLFLDEALIKADGRYVNNRLRTELGVGIANIFSYVYFDTAAMPQQTSKTLMVLTAWGKQNFRLGNFYFDQTVYFQKSTQEDILSLPAISVYSHNYFQHALFKNALFLQTGIDVFYNTKFYADNYMPSIMQFYNQRERKTGNYPKLDVFLNLRIKRADIFVKYEHINYLLKNHGDFFSAADYPINPGMLKFGIKWDFFD